MDSVLRMIGLDVPTLTLGRSIGALLVASIVLPAAWLCCHVLYNIFLHPLRKFPGPTSWAATRLPWCYEQYHGRLNQSLLELHIKYGHTVRIAPNELSCTTESAWKAVYQPRHGEMPKDPVFRLHTATGAKNLFVADRETHTRQRRLVSHAFSEKALREQESILVSYANKLLDQLSARSSGGVNMVAWYNFTTFDLIGDMSFGEHFGCLDTGDYVPFVRAIESMSKELTFMQMFIYYRLQKIRQYFMPKGVAGARFQNIKRAMDTVDRRINRSTDRKDFLYYILAANDEKGMSRAEIDVNAFSFSIAGSESTATLLCGATYYLLNNRPSLDILTREIRDTFASESDITLASTNGLEYLEAVIQESLRLYPPVAGTLPRQVPPNGETAIDGAYVPAGASVGVNHYSCYRHPANFHRAEAFLPERWLPGVREAAPFDGDNRGCVQPFSFGPRNCVGKSLARAEIRLILAKMLWRFEVELVEGRGDWMEGQRVWGFWQKPPLMCQVKEVKRG